LEYAGVLTELEGDESNGLEEDVETKLAVARS
jgi:hypothetical protein